MKVKVTARSWTGPDGKKHSQGSVVDVDDRGVLHNAVHSGRVSVVSEKAAPATDGKVK